MVELKSLVLVRDLKIIRKVRVGRLKVKFELKDDHVVVVGLTFDEL